MAGSAAHLVPGVLDLDAVDGAAEPGPVGAGGVAPREVAARLAGLVGWPRVFGAGNHRVSAGFQQSAEGERAPHEVPKAVARLQLPLACPLGSQLAGEPPHVEALRLEVIVEERK